MLTCNLLWHCNTLEASTMEAHSVYVVTFHLASLPLLVKQINNSSIGGTISVSLILL